MKVVQSFWSGGSTTIQKYGWLSAKYHFLGWILSANQLRKYYDNLELVTDSFGYSLLIETLKLPYTDVRVELDELNRYPSGLWALAKVKAYQLQNKPFLHVDGDVFIWKEFSKELLESGLISQNKEIITKYYRNMWDDISCHLCYLPKSLHAFDNGYNNYSYNMGIFGGYDLDFIKEYTNKILSFVSRNCSVWTKINLFNFNIFFEQVLFYGLTKESSKNVSTMFSNVIKDGEYIGLDDFDSIPKKTYLHLLGPFKRQLTTCKKLESYVMNFYPKYYERLEKLIKQEPLSSYLEYDYTLEKNITLKKNYADLLAKNRCDNVDKTPIKNWRENILGRDLFMVGQVQFFWKLMKEERCFLIIPIADFEIVISSHVEKKIVIKELDGNNIEESWISIDEIIFNELKGVCDNQMFIENSLKYLSEDFPDDEKEAFLETLWLRVAQFISLKIFVAVRGDFLTNPGKNIKNNSLADGSFYHYY
ncbi:DUF6734 family protein [Sinomicrobium sp. M5D2P9]